MTTFVDSKKKKLSEDEIYKIAAKETGGKYTAEQIKASLGLEAYQMGALMLRQGNTIFVVHQHKQNPTMAVFRAINADTLNNYLKNSIEFVKAVGEAGFQYLVTEFDDQAILSIFKYIYKKQPYQNMGYAIQQYPKSKRYRATINLGDTPKLKKSEEHKKQLAKEAKTS